MNLNEQISRIKEMMGINEGLFDNLFSKGKSVDETDPEFIDDEKSRFTCTDCGNPEYNMYMVNDDLWSKYGNNRNTLCLSCFEKRLGRKVTKDDFQQHRNAAANLHNPEVVKIMNQSDKDDFSYFETSQGSKYIRNSKGQVRRWKSSHANTGGEDMGLHGWSNFSIFVDPKFQYEANSLQYLIGKGYKTAIAKNKDGRIVIMIFADGDWRPAKWNDAYPIFVKHNSDYDGKTIMFEYTKEPTIGYHVVDFDLRPNSTIISGYHFGSDVSRVEDSIPDDAKKLFFKNL